MIIVVACDVPLNGKNGTAVAAGNLINALRAGGHEVRILCPDASLAGKPGCYVTQPINFGPLNGYVRRNGVVISRGNRRIAARALDGADELHVITPFFLCCGAARIARKRGISVTAGFHCQAENFSNHFFLMNARFVNRLIYRVFYRILYRKVDCIHYPTQFIRAVFESEIRRKPRGRVISNGVGKEFVNAPGPKPEEYADRFVILFTGRYSKEKSHKVLIRAVAKSAYSDRIQLIFAGDGPLRRDIEAYSAKKLKNPPVFGFHSKEELIRIINYSDLYVHPAEIEIEAIACLEAIRCGLVPVISDSPRSATRFFALNSRNLFRCNDAADLAEKIDYWIEHPEEKRQCGNQYLGYTARFDRERCMEEMEDMIRGAAERKHEA